MDLALGVRVEEFDIATMRPVVYQKPPDVKAASYLVDRVMGKPTQKVEADVDADIRTRIVVEYADTPVDPA